MKSEQGLITLQAAAIDFVHRDRKVLCRAVCLVMLHSLLSSLKFWQRILLVAYLDVLFQTCASWLKPDSCESRALEDSVVCCFAHKGDPKNLNLNLNHIINLINI